MTNVQITLPDELARRAGIAIVTAREVLEHLVATGRT
jgi:hypothetical protein